MLLVFGFVGGYCFHTKNGTVENSAKTDKDLSAGTFFGTYTFGIIIKRATERAHIRVKPKIAHVVAGRDVSVPNCLCFLCFI